MLGKMFGLLVLAIQLKVSFCQGCGRIFGRATTIIQEKSILEIANAAVDEMCQGTCTTDFNAPEICPLISSSVEQYTATGFALIPTYDMTLIVTQPEILSPKSYRLDIIFDYNSFSGDVFLYAYNYTQLEQELYEMEENSYDIIATEQLRVLEREELLLAGIDLFELESEIDLVENSTDLIYLEPDTEE